MRTIECDRCGRPGPAGATVSALHTAARAEGWSRLYNQRKGAHFRCPECRAMVRDATASDADNRWCALTVRMDPDIYDRLLVVAEETSSPLAAYARQAIIEKLDRDAR